MNHLTDKKWFVYFGDHHEGPFSINDIQILLNQSKISKMTLVWKDGMPSWKSIIDLVEFAPILQPAAPARPVVSAISQGTTFGIPQSSNLSIGGKVTKRLILTLIGLCAFAGGGFYYLTRMSSGIELAIELSQRLPSLTPWIAPLPRIADVLPEDYSKLWRTVAAPIAQGRKILVVRSMEDTVKPSFYIATNAADGRNITLSIRSEAGTLVGELSASAEQSVKLERALNRTNAITRQNAENLPMGYYTVFLKEESKFATPLRVFIGGEPGQKYDQSLGDFRKKIKDKAQGELNELNQFYATLRQQYVNSRATYEKLLRSPSGKKVLKEWEQFHLKWFPFQSSLVSATSVWMSKNLEKEYFYFGLYPLVQKICRSVVDVHDAEGVVLRSDSKQKNQAVERFQKANLEANRLLIEGQKLLNQAKEKFENPTGFPDREGLIAGPNPS